MKVGEQYKEAKTFRVGDNDLYLTALRLEKEFLIAAMLHHDTQALAIYKEQWQIETLFKALKSQGFRLEDTHLTEPKRRYKILALLAIAFVWCYRVGIWKHAQQPIRMIKKVRKTCALSK